MALTTVRSPVTDIDNMSFGTTSITLPSSGGPIDINVTGLNVMDFTSTTVIVDPLVTLTAVKFNTEVITLTTSGGSTAKLETAATLAKLGTTSAHPLELYANNITALTIATDGKVELDIEGTAANHLITKGFVDNLITTQASGNQTSTGHLRVPVSSGNDIIINWGKNASVADSTDTQVTFDLAFPTAFFVGFANSTTLANHDGTMSVIANSLTTMNIWSSLDKASTFDWLAIGS